MLCENAAGESLVLSPGPWAQRRGLWRNGHCVRNAQIILNQSPCLLTQGDGAKSQFRSFRWKLYMITEGRQPMEQPKSLEFYFRMSQSTKACAPFPISYWISRKRVTKRRDQLSECSYCAFGQLNTGVTLQGVFILPLFWRHRLGSIKTP